MRIDFTTIKNNLGKLLKKFWQNLFLILILLLCLDLILGVMFFSRYYLEAQKKKPAVTPTVNLNQGLLKIISSQWLIREETFQKAAEKQYPNPFRRFTIEQSLE